jgi:hypothetical protein
MCRPNSNLASPECMSEALSLEPVCSVSEDNGICETNVKLQFNEGVGRLRRTWTNELQKVWSLNGSKNLTCGAEREGCFSVLLDRRGFLFKSGTCTPKNILSYRDDRYAGRGNATKKTK